MSLRIRSFRGPLASEGIGERSGFLVRGTDGRGSHISIFTYTRASAEQIKCRLTAGREIDSRDFAAQPGGSDRA